MRPFKTSQKLTATVLASGILLGACAPMEVSTLRAVPHADLEILDPTSTTAYITRSHGYLVYDTLFALDQNLEPQPQMVDTWETSEDGKVWTFRLRDGLAWHDGTPVTAADCITSLERWGKVDGMGQALFDRVKSLEAADDQTIVMTLSAPYDRVTSSLAKLSSNVPFMMPASVASTPPSEPLTSTIGSGPFKFSADEWDPGKRVVYTRNEEYVSRAEPTSLGAGAKIAKVDRIEWVSYPDQEAAVQALLAGEVDYLESPSTASVTQISENPEITIAYTDPLGNVGMAVFNRRIPPFNKRRVREAVLKTIDQTAYMDAAFGDPTLWRTCYSVYACDTPYSTEAGSEIIQTADLGAAEEALRRSGYRGEKVVILHPTDSPVLSAFTEVTAERLTEIGMNIVLEDMTWAELVKRRVNQGPVEDGGWNMFHTWWIAADLMEPTQIAYSGDPKTGWVGLPYSPRSEKLRAEFAAATSEEDRAEIAAELQKTIWANATFGILGQFFEPIAFRNNVIGQQSPLQMYYNLGILEQN